MTDQLYHDLIVECARNPKHAGRLAAYDSEGHGDNPLCGDRIHLYLRRDGAAVSFEAQGCAIMLASAELMAEAVAGIDPPQIRHLRSAFEAVVTTGAENPSLGRLNALANVSEYRSRIRCATLPWAALAQALEAPLAQALEAPLNQALEAPLNQALEAPLNQALEAPLNQTLEAPLNQALEGAE